MGKLTPKQSRALAGMMRRLLKAIRDLNATQAILRDAAHLGICPVDWEQNLEILRKTPEYRAAGKELEPLIAATERDADETEVFQLLEKIEKEGPPN